MRKLWIGFALLGLVVAAVLLWKYWPIPNPMEELQLAEDFILYSIDGREEDRIKLDKPPIPRLSETFHNYPVYGKVKIDDSEERRKLIAAFKDALSVPGADKVKCFWPRHAIHAVVKGKTVEYVICFQCIQFYRFEKDPPRQTYGVLNSEKSVRPVFDKPLTDAGIPIAPE